MCSIGGHMIMGEVDKLRNLLIHLNVYEKYEDILEDIEGEIQHYNSPKCCFMCGTPISYMHGIPRNSMIFSTNGSAFSRTFDDNMPMLLAMCDDCVLSNLEKFAGNTNLRIF